MELPRPPNPPNCPKTNVKNRIKMVIRRSKENANVWVVIKREEVKIDLFTLIRLTTIILTLMGYIINKYF